MVTLDVRTPEGLTLRTEVAGAGSRFAAGVLDALMYTSIYASIGVVVMGLLSVDVTGLGGWISGLMAVGFVLGFCVANAAVLMLYGGRTPGKKLLELRVVSADGYPASAMQCFLRSLLLPIDNLFFPLPGLVAITWSQRRQRLGDLVAGTTVVRERAGTAERAPFAGERWSELEAPSLPLGTGMAARFTNEDYELLRDLWTRRGLDEGERRRIFVRAARFYAQRIGVSEFNDARVVLKELYLFLRESREGD